MTQTQKLFSILLTLSKRAVRTMNNYKKKGYFLTFLWILLAIVVIIILSYKAINVYLGKFSFNKETKIPLLEKDADTPRHETIFDSTKKEIERLDRQLLNHTKQLKDFR